MNTLGISAFVLNYRLPTSTDLIQREIAPLQDAQAAIQYIRKNAEQWKISPNLIGVVGTSAGGHLAAATATINDYNESSDNTAISCIPDALVLFNPVFDNGPGGYGYERIGEAYKNFSPLHNIKSGAPPTIVFLGDKDHLIPAETAKYYKTIMEKVKSRCDLFVYEGQGHGFFNYKNLEYYKKTVSETDTFLQSIGFLNKDPFVEIK